MTTRVRRILALLLILAMALSLAACGSGLGDLENEIPESSGGKDVERAPALDNVFSVNSNSKYSKNPFIATHHANQLICDLVYENMIELDDNFEVITDAGVIVVGAATVSGGVLTYTLTGRTDGGRVTSNLPNDEAARLHGVPGVAEGDEAPGDTVEVTVVHKATGNEFTVKVPVKVVDDVPVIGGSGPDYGEGLDSVPSGGEVTGSVNFSYGMDNVPPAEDGGAPAKQSFGVAKGGAREEGFETVGAGVVTVAGDYGELTVSGDGSYSYRAYANKDIEAKLPQMREIVRKYAQEA